MARKKKTVEKPLFGGLVKSPDVYRRTLTGKKFVFTAAQNNTELHEGFWESLQTYCRENDAQLFVSRFTYNKAGWAYYGGVSKDMPGEEERGLWYDARIEPYLLDEQVKVTDGLLFCGELDILPTAVHPLSGLQNYTGANSGIVPHAKVAMQSLATMKHHEAKFLYTTGACTLRNYIQRKAGQKATFHHVFGALVVELTDNGEWFARQIMADDSGAFYDLNNYYYRDISGVDTENEFLVTLGDVHIEKIDYEALAGAMDMIATINPKHVMLHDLIDFEARNHHNIKNPHFRAKQYFQGVDSVEANMEAGARFLHALQTKFPETKLHVIRSNHDQAFERWLADPSGLSDPANAWYWHYWNYVWHKSIKRGCNDDIFAHAMELIGHQNDFNLGEVHWVKEDESLIIHDIEHGMHGHRGCNGARGNPPAFRQLGRKVVTGHTHSCGIIDGVWTAGVLGRLDMGYNTGPSSWSHSSIITYPNGKRAMITQRGSKWRA